MPRVAVIVSATLPEQVQRRIRAAFSGRGAACTMVAHDAVVGGSPGTLHVREDGPAGGDPAPEQAHRVDAVLAMVVGSSADRHLRDLQVPVINDPAVVARSSSKLAQHRLLAGAGLPTPPTVAAPNAAAARQAAPVLLAGLGGQAGCVVTKPARGYGGRGVTRHHDARELVNRLVHASEALVVQRYLPEIRRGDIRVLVVDGRPIAAMRRLPADPDEWRTNLTLGGRGQAHQLTDEQAGLAVAATAARELVMAGVDLVDTDDGPVVLEVNAAPGTRIAWVCDVDVFDPIAGAVLDRID